MSHTLQEINDDDHTPMELDDEESQSVPTTFDQIHKTLETLPIINEIKRYESQSGVEIVISQTYLELANATDAIISPYHDPTFSTGMERDVADQAGDPLIEEYRSRMSTKPSCGDITVTKGYKLGCNSVVHVSMKRPNDGSADSRQETFNIVYDCVVRCLRLADQTLGVKIVLLPFNKYDGTDHTPELYIEAVGKALSDVVNGNVQCLRKVYVAHPEIEVCFALQSVFDDCFDECGHSRGAARGFSHAGASNWYGIHDEHDLVDEDVDDSFKETNKITKNYGSEEDLRQEGTDPGTNSKTDESSDEEEKRCPICFDDFDERTDLQILHQCKHKFCKQCIERAMKDKPACPVCGKMYGTMTGNQPHGTMTTSECGHTDLPGYPNCGHIRITYNIPSGQQGLNHPNPGRSYSGTTRTAYLPNNAEGQRVLQLLRKAFADKLIFTIGTSVTTGASDTVTWNDIHHKTNMTGGPQSFGYPDQSYLRRVTEELATKGIK